jgi:hypothetical protein
MATSSRSTPSPLRTPRRSNCSQFYRQTLIRICIHVRIARVCYTTAWRWFRDAGFRSGQNEHLKPRQEFKERPVHVLPGEDVEFRRLSRNSGAIKLPKTGEVSRERIRLSHRHAEDEARRENVSDWTPISSVCAARNPSAVCGLSLGHRMESTSIFRWQNRRWMCSCSSRSAAIRLPSAVQDQSGPCS